MSLEKQNLFQKSSFRMGVIIIEIKTSDDFTKIQTQLKGGLVFWKTGQWKAHNVHALGS